MNYLILILIIVCILGGIRATLDWSNLDLVSFEYFKYPKTTPKPFYFRRFKHLYSARTTTKPPSKLEETINRTKAVIKYFTNLAFGNPDDRIRSPHILDPEFGRKWSQAYQSKHGKFGKKLVDQLGSGISPYIIK